MTENKRFKYSDVWGWNIDGFLNVMNGLDRKNNELKERIKELEKENENQNNILEDFMVMLNRLQANPNDEVLQSMAKDMLRMMGKEIMGDD